MSLAASSGGCTSARPSTRSISARGRPPGRSSIGASKHPTMVDSTPTATAPPSTIRSIRPARSLCTWAAVVGETWPDRLAEGATTGPPNARRKSPAPPDAREPGSRSYRARRWRDRPPSQSPVFGSTSVSGPGQNASASASAVASKRAIRRAALRSLTWAISGLKDGPALGLVEPRDGGGIGGVGSEPIDGLGRKRDQPAPGEAIGRRGHGGLVCSQNLRCQACIHGNWRPQFGFLRYANPKAISRVLVGVWLSPVEHCVRDAGVAGSNPATPTK